MRFCFFLFLWMASPENAAEKNAFSNHSFMEKEAMMCKTKRLAQKLFVYPEKHMLFQRKKRYDAQFV